MGMLETERDRYADEGEPPMAWERYLELAPTLSGIEVDAREEVLAAREMDGDTWERAESYWTLALALELRQGRTERSESYGKACAEASQASRRAEHAVEPTLPEAGALGPSSPAVAPVSPPAPASPLDSGPMSALVAASEVAVPTFMRAPPKIAAELAPPALPHVVQLAAPVHVSVGSPRPVAAASRVGSHASRDRATVEISPFALAPGRVALPFTPAPAAVTAAAPSRASRSPVQSGATLDLSAVRFDPRGNDAPSEDAGSGGRDRRTDAGTVELDPSVLAAFFAKKPPSP